MYNDGPEKRHRAHRVNDSRTRKDRNRTAAVEGCMKLAHDLAPLAFTVISGFACTPGSNRGATASTSNDAPNDTPQEPPTDPARNVASQVLTPSPPHPIAVPVPVPRAGPYRVRIVGASTRELPTFYHDGRNYVFGAAGDRYAIVLSNPTPQRVEAVVSIDGLDAIDGTTADYVHKRGYILPAYGTATIEGFRTSSDQVATFRFSSVAESYAGRLGQARDVGVIGVAFFPESGPVAVAPPPAPMSPRFDDSAGASAYRHNRPAPVPPSPSPAGHQEQPAPATASVSRAEPERKGLGTQFGEARESRVWEVMFTRANATSPSEVVALRYNDRAGLMALGIRVDPPAVADTELRTRETADPFRANRFALPPP